MLTRFIHSTLMRQFQNHRVADKTTNYRVAFKIKSHDWNLQSPKLGCLFQNTDYNTTLWIHSLWNKIAN